MLEIASMIAFLLVFVVICGVGMLVVPRMNEESRKAPSRLRERSKDRADDKKPAENREALPGLGQWMASGQRAADVRTRLARAGIFHPQALTWFLAAKVVSAVLVLSLASTPFFLGLTPLNLALVQCAIGGLL